VRNAGHNVLYILLMRHAKHGPERPGQSSNEGEAKYLEDIAASLRKLVNRLPYEDDRNVLSPLGLAETQSVARTIDHRILFGGEGIVIAGIIYAESKETKATADLMVEMLHLDESQRRPSKLLGPDIQSGPKKTVATRIMADIYKEADNLCLANQKAGGNAVLVIGHQPLLGWISQALSAEAYPLANYFSSDRGWVQRTNVLFCAGVLVHLIHVFSSIGYLRRRARYPRHRSREISSRAV
jgi:hypothetical protein